MTAKKHRPKYGDPVVAGMTERDISAALGMSRRKIWQAKKIADIPEDEFERMVESDDPPTATQLLNVAQHRAGSEPERKSCPHCGGNLG